MTGKFSRSCAVAVAALLTACAPQTRSIDAPGTGASNVYAVEKEIRDGKVTLPKTGEKALRRRVAVVIGNSAYAHVSRLRNPRNDAKAMANVLRANGFQVVQGVDIGKRSFERLLRNAVRAGGPGAEIVAFYAGHGFQVGSKNYLVPTDANLKSSNDLPFQTVRLSTIMRILGTRSDRHISFLDSCRNNPFPATETKTGAARGTSSTAIGFSEPRVPRGGFVVYSTKPGAVAYDGEGTPNSPFTGALLGNIRKRPTAGLLSTLRRVRSSVRSATGGKQTPTWTSRIKGGFAFKPRTERTAKITPKAAEVGTKTPVRPVAVKTPDRPASAPKGAPLPTNKPVTVDAPMEKVIAAGPRIAEKLNLPDDATVSIVRPPVKGNMAKIAADATLTDPEPKDLKVADAGALVYVAPPDQKPVTTAASAVVTDTMVVEIKMPDSAPQRVEVNLRLTPNACDIEAGEFLDLQGVGVFRPADKISSRRAIQACGDAVKEDPGNGRFQFQLGKALEAAGRLQQAVNAYEKASRLGHLRAKNALGQIAITIPGQEPIGMIYFRRCAAEGDPVCVQSLGILLLSLARTPADREEAYELLSYAIDFGLPEAMRALADHFDNPATPDHDPERAGVFNREAEVREREIGRVVRPVNTTGTPTSISIPDPGASDGGGDSGGGSGNY